MTQEKKARKQAFQGILVPLAHAGLNIPVSEEAYGGALQLVENEHFVPVVRAIEESVANHYLRSRPDLLGDVLAFHQKFGVQKSTLDVNHEIAASMQKVKLQHLWEELVEYEEAVGRGDMVDAFDSLIDLIYVALGCVSAHRFQEIFYEGWNRVHMANMTKRRAESAAESKRGTKFDVVKPEGWKAAELAELVEGS
jgi:hypothetical protein